MEGVSHSELMKKPSGQKEKFANGTSLGQTNVTATRKTGIKADATVALRSTVNGGLRK